MLNCKIYFCRFLILSLSLAIAACTTMQINSTPPVAISQNARIAVLPFTNMTETPQADGRASVITEALLRSRGFVAIPYPTAITTQSIIPGVKPEIPRAQLLAWARDNHLPYAIIGTVNEWRYKIGLDGEPVVGITLELINTSNGRVIWTVVGSKSGGSRTALTTVAQRLIENMLVTLIRR
jgi:TolB-like protein